MRTDLSKYFSKEDIQMTNKHMKRYLMSLVFKEIYTHTHSKPQWDSTQIHWVGVHEKDWSE